MLSSVRVLTKYALEHIFQGLEKFRVAFVNLEIYLPQIRCTRHAHFHVHPIPFTFFFFLLLYVILPVRSNRWPPHYLCPTSQYISIIHSFIHSSKHIETNIKQKHLLCRWYNVVLLITCDIRTIAYALFLTCFRRRSLVASRTRTFLRLIATGQPQSQLCGLQIKFFFIASQ